MPRGIPNTSLSETELREYLSERAKKKTEYSRKWRETHPDEYAAQRRRYIDNRRKNAQTRRETVTDTVPHDEA